MDLSQDIQNFKSPVQQLEHPLFKEKGLDVFIKREDLLPYFSSGNKFRKLYYNLKEAKALNRQTWITFGGAYSNHILATAEAGAHFKVPTVGIIRGEELGVDLEATLKSNLTLKRAQALGMQFHFVSRMVYRKKDNDVVCQKIIAQYPKPYLIPEGGTNDLAIKGCTSILNAEDILYDFVFCPVGTGGTISGIIESSQSHQKIIGISALKGNFLTDEVEQFTAKKNWKIQTNYHFGGYAKFNEELITFINEFFDETGIPLEPIYSGKMLYGLFDMVKKNYFSEKNRILVVHTGGLQSIASINQKLGRKGLQKIKVLSDE